MCLLNSSHSWALHKQTIVIDASSKLWFNHIPLLLLSIEVLLACLAGLEALFSSRAGCLKELIG
jgi:hypothetical protein